MLAQERLTLPCLRNRSGMALYLVLAVLIAVSLVAQMFLNLILSQSKLTYHQAARTQAYFAGRMGMNYAIEMLRNNDPSWPATGPYNRTICRSGCNKTEPDLPATIENITIFVDVFDINSGTRPLNITVNYKTLQ